MMNNPTRIDAGIPKAPPRAMCGIMIQYDPNNGNMTINTSGFISPSEEIGVFEYAKAMRLNVFVKMSDPQQKDIVIANAAAVPPFKQ